MDDLIRGSVLPFALPTKQGVARMKTASWIIVDLSTGKAVLETFSHLTANRINTAKYKAVPILKYLQDFNKGVTK